MYIKSISAMGRMYYPFVRSRTFHIPDRLRHFHQYTYVTSCSFSRPNLFHALTPLPSCSREGLLCTLRRQLCTRAAKQELSTSEVTFKSCGGTFKATYADAGDQNGPVVVCLHGSPASHKDFAAISPYLLSAGVRLIAPNFPGYGYCTAVDGDAFNFTPEHKSLFLRDLLETIGIERISVLVSHSASGTTTGQFCADTNFVDSVAFLSACNVRPHRPARLGGRSLHVSSWLIDHAVTGKLVQKIIPQLTAKLSGFRVSDPRFMIGLIHEMAAVNWPKTAENLKELHKSSIPVLVIGCKEDKVVEVEIAQETMELLNIDQARDVLHVDADGECINGSLTDHSDKRRRGIIFTRGTHWIQNSYPQLIATAILDLLKLTEK